MAPVPRERRAPQGALFCTVANTTYGLLAGGGGCLVSLFGAIGSAGAFRAEAMVGLGFFCSFAVCGLGLLAGGIWGIVGLVKRNRSLVTGLKVATIAAGVGIPGALLSCLMGVAVVVARDTFDFDDTPAELAGAAMAVLGCFAVGGFLPLPLFVLNLLAFLRARKDTWWSDRELGEVFE